MTALSPVDQLCAAVSRLGSEAAFEVLGRARVLQAQGRDIVHMEIGEPDFDTPAHIKAAGIDAINDNFTHYAPNAGIMELRETIAQYATHFRRLATPYTPDMVVVAPGAKPIIWNLLSALLDPGDEMVFADPAYPTYAAAAGYLGAKSVPVPLRESMQWRLDLDELKSALSPRTKVLVLNSPHNPTGGVLTRDDLATIAELARTYRFVILTDEIYSRNIYGTQFESITQFDDLRERTIVVDGFSKAYAMTGWRLGYCIAPVAIARAATLLANNTYACTSSFIQRAGIAALRGDDAPVVAMNETFRARRDRFVAQLNDIPGLVCPLPEGAFYVFPNVMAFAKDDVALASYLLEEGGVAVLGGSCFGPAGRGCLRLSYANSIAELDRAVERLAAALPRYRER